MKKTKVEKGITLIALIITVVVLMILATVAITSIQNDGIIEYANNAVDKYEQKQAEENTFLNEYEDYLNNYFGNGGSTGYEEVALAVAITDDMYSRMENSQTEDIYGNIIKIPAGFKILVDETTVYTGVADIAVEKGIVITDGINEFVYVPVGDIKTASATKKITLARYEFDVTLNMSTGAIEGTGARTETHTSAEAVVRDPIITLMASAQELGDIYFKEGEFEVVYDQGKGYALNISEFYSKASSGYYIGRYEARTNSAKARENGDELTGVTLNKINAVYNYITQPAATSKCQSMYTNKPFTTDLVNSFAWDTAIAFIQAIEGDGYSKQASVNIGFSNTGTVEAETEDKVCNIYDMASNCKEWSTETCFYPYWPCTSRGGCGMENNLEIENMASARHYGDAVLGSFDTSFRPILYL